MHNYHLFFFFSSLMLFFYRWKMESSCLDRSYVSKSTNNSEKNQAQFYVFAVFGCGAVKFISQRRQVIRGIK
jgi:hypothetical protein